MQQAAVLQQWHGTVPTVQEREILVAHLADLDH